MIEIDFHKNLDFREFEIKEYILLYCKDPLNH